MTLKKGNAFTGHTKLIKETIYDSLSKQNSRSKASGQISQSIDDKLFGGEKLTSVLLTEMKNLKT